MGVPADAGEFRLSEPELPPPERFIEIIRDAAAAVIMPRFRKLADGDVFEKAPGDIVTAADIEAENWLAEALVDLVPESVAVGEEAAFADPGLLDVLADKAPVWLIDPVDGTQNFADGIACFAVIVALCADGRTLAGWIHDPCAGETAFATAGGGAWLFDAAGRKRMRVAPSVTVSDMSGVLGGRLRDRLALERRCAPENVPRKMVRLGCVGREYLDLAHGRLHFAQYGGRLKPWDHAAGVLIHAEAGGLDRLVGSGTAYAPRAGIIEDMLRLAPDETAWRALHAAFEPR